MAVNYIKLYLSIAMFLVVTGCVSDPKRMKTIPLENSISLQSGPFAIITSVAEPELLDKLHVPRESLKSLMDPSVLEGPPTSIDGKETMGLSARFLGVPIDGNFRIAVLPGMREIGYRYTDRNYVTREMIVVFDAKENHEYYAKFIGEAVGRFHALYKIKPIIYDLTEGKNVQFSVINDNSK